MIKINLVMTKQEILSEAITLGIGKYHKPDQRRTKTYSVHKGSLIALANPPFDMVALSGLGIIWSTASVELIRTYRVDIF